MSDDVEHREVTTEEKFRALRASLAYRPVLTGVVMFLSVVAAVLEGLGLSFIVPIVEQVQSGGTPSEDPTGVMSAFSEVYGFFGVALTLESIVVGVVLVMIVRYTTSFVVGWMGASLEADYIRHLQSELFENALDARIAYFDRNGSDKILNKIVTEASYAAKSLRQAIYVFEQSVLCLMYLAIAVYLAPVLTVGMAVFLGGLVFLIRGVLESGYDVGDRVAAANERIQEIVQAGTQGIRDVKLFGMTDELSRNFGGAVDTFVSSTVTLRRNETAVDRLYELVVAVTVFVLIYFAVTFASMSLGALGVFLFAMFRLGPKLSYLNNHVYSLEGNLPHLVRTRRTIASLAAHAEPNPATRQLPTRVRGVRFDDVGFAYDPDDPVVDGLSFAVDRGEFVAFVGPSGAGKSTVVALLTRMYDPDRGAIYADDVPIEAAEIGQWRSRVSVVRQNPYIFNDTLRYNVTVGNRDASDAEVDQACRIAQVDEFLDGLPRGYDTVLGDDGVRLSGGQRQRIAIARALLADADVLVFDEATSDLDTALERHVHRGIEEMERDVALIVIAHRLSTVTNADRIYTMEDGHVVEAGTHEQLLENEGRYASLYTIQT
ncbi:ABC transporter ATP-binding protein [Halomarina oriensis]|uniref:ATP-binding cassette domain-containing protein n=1 Tax=Halomarina oriensis TaxID=671145 RepID=A0A6B0GN26_9EURY|nr:ABC transporter ATP-binding protein [Halomarina oriensis]MWG36326.1 ATP-binding cassette domain-containing protein [Halomarina oriensis]